MLRTHKEMFIAIGRLFNMYWDYLGFITNSILFFLIGIPVFSLFLLQSSIEQNGLLQPILVRTMIDYFEVVAGNRRFSACKALGWKRIACHIIELDDRQVL
jgi:ParB-like nuclease domain